MTEAEVPEPVRVTERLREQLLETAGALLIFDGHVTDPRNPDGWMDSDAFEQYIAARNLHDETRTLCAQVWQLIQSTTTLQAQLGKASTVRDQALSLCEEAGRIGLAAEARAAKLVEAVKELAQLVRRALGIVSQYREYDNWETDARAALAEHAGEVYHANAR